MLPAAVVVAVLLGLWWFTPQSDLFVVSVRHGRVLLLRGRAPAALLADFAAVVARPPVSQAPIRAIRGERGGRLVFSGALDEDRQQRLRNVFGLFPAARLRHAPAIAKPTLGQLLGVAWLAWWLDRRM